MYNFFSIWFVSSQTSTLVWFSFFVLMAYQLFLGYFNAKAILLEEL